MASLCCQPQQLLGAFPWTTLSSDVCSRSAASRRGAVVELLPQQRIALLQLGGAARDGLFEFRTVLRLLQSAGALSGTIAFGLTLGAQCPRQIAGHGPRKARLISAVMIARCHTPRSHSASASLRGNAACTDQSPRRSS